MRRVRGDRGSGTVLVLALAAAAAVSVAGTGLVGGAVVTRHRAEAAADLAALAGATVVRDGGSAATGCAAAGRVARANGGSLTRCTAAPNGDVTVRAVVRGAVTVTHALDGSAVARAGPHIGL